MPPLLMLDDHDLPNDIDLLGVRSLLGGATGTCGSGSVWQHWLSVCGGFLLAILSRMESRA